MRKSYKVLCCGLTLTALIGSTVLVAHAAGEVAFSDLGGHWAEKSILAMCEGVNPLFKGVGTGEDGLALFAPEKEMTGAEFVTVLVRAYYGDELNSEPTAGAWYSPAWTVAERHGLVDETDTAYQEVAIPRKVMAKIIVKAMIMRGETLELMALTSSIADYDQIGAEYQNFVRQVYSMGIITGTDQAGTFSPDLTVSRAQGATILNRLVNPVERVEFSYKAPLRDFPYSQKPSEIYRPTNMLQTFHEGEAHTIPQVGDTVITKDGRIVVLTMNYVGTGRFLTSAKDGEGYKTYYEEKDLYLLGWGQGVDIITGTIAKEGGQPRGVGHQSWADGSPFCDNKVNNEVYSKTQWAYISGVLGEPKEDGKYEGEIRNIYYQWDTIAESWLWIGGR